MVTSVLKQLFPDRASSYTNYLFKNIEFDEQMMVGALAGGKDYYDFLKQKIPPLRLVSFLQ
jgi:hypothetical protein